MWHLARLYGTPRRFPVDQIGNRQYREYEMDSTRKSIAAKLLEYRATCLQEQKEKEAFKSLQAETKALIEVNEVVKQVAIQFQETAHTQIATIVTECLQAVFGQYEFRITFEKRRNKTEAIFTIIGDRGEELDPTNSVGGGVLDVAAFGLRIACLVLSKPVRRRILILDEPFKMISREFRSNVREMLERISSDLEVQIIMITHDESYITGNVIRIDS